MNKETKDLLIKLFEKWSDETVVEFYKLPQSGSNRDYYRICGKNKKAIGVYNTDKRENLAFLDFSKQLINKKINVPSIYGQNLEQNIYLIEDLGDLSLYQFILDNRTADEFPNLLVDLYKNIIEHLVEIQVLAGKNFDYKYAYPRKAFDKQSIMWDLNYFKYHFLKFTNIPFYEQDLEDDFIALEKYLNQTDTMHFLFRDFQSRNIMMCNNKIYFIDYQGGRKGALQYDLASLLYDAKANITEPIRNILLKYYIESLGKYKKVDKLAFRNYYYAYALIRILQAMGAYGFRGLFERKKHFIESIPYAIENIRNILDNFDISYKFPHLHKVLRTLIDSKQFKRKNLSIKITSFSYKKGLPVDKTKHGGGFVFDCRAIHNPGRYDEYKQLTGKDKKVIDFFETKTDINDFLLDIYSIIDRVITKYLKRNYNYLTISFGCTGGQHRSVYSAESINKYINNKYDITTTLNHRELGLQH